MGESDAVVGDQDSWIAAWHIQKPEYEYEGGVLHLPTYRLYKIGEFEEKVSSVYYLHGGRPGNELKSIKLVAEVDRAMSAQKVAPMIYVFVNGGPVSHYNMPDDPSAQGADVFINELIPHIDSTYRTIADRGGRGIEGFSQGGRGTARLMFRHPELFCSASPVVAAMLQKRRYRRVADKNQLN